jgi:WD40 repeat protein
MITLSNKHLVTATIDGQINVWNTRTGVRNATYNHSKEYVLALTQLTNGYLASASVGGTIKIWNVNDYKLNGLVSTIITSKDGISKKINALIATTNGYLISGSDDATINIFSVKQFS